MTFEDLHGRDGEYWFYAPFLTCEFCPELTPLPYPNLPQTDQDQLRSARDSDLLTLPPDGWSLTLACCGCGRVQNRSSPDIFCEVVRHTSSGRFHDEATFYAVEFPCGDRRCQAPQTIHVDSPGRSERELISLFRDGFLHARETV